MADHQTYLSIGSNLSPEHHLPRGLALLAEHGQIAAHSTAWESKAIGDVGPNFLNACVLFVANADMAQLADAVVRPIERALGRVRGADKFAPRTIDVDIVMFDGSPMRLEEWTHAYIVVPMAELLPDLYHPVTQEPLHAAARRARQSTWMLARPDVLKRNLT